MEKHLNEQPDLDWQAAIEQERRGKALGSQVRAYTSCSSTQTLAWQWAGQGAPHGSVVVTKQQSAGFGRLGRSWWCAGGSLAMSVILKPKLDVKPQAYSWLFAVGLLRFLAQLGITTAKAKWPNDILLQLGDQLPLNAPLYPYGKWAGALCQASWLGGKLDTAVVGVGANLVRPAQMPDYVPPCGFLSDVLSIPSPNCQNTSVIPAKAGIQSCISQNINTFLHPILDNLQQVLHEAQTPTGHKHHWQYYRDKCITIGKQVQVKKVDKTVTGLALDVQQDGALQVQSPSGKTDTVYAGDVLPA